MNPKTLARSLRVAAQLARAKLTGQRIPVRVALQTTKRCNMRCTYCYANFDAYEHMEDRSYEDTCRLLDELWRHGTRWIWFLGGEPMLYKDFGRVIDYAHDLGMFCDMNSNGLLINEKTVQTVGKLDAVCVSIDGDEASNDVYRGKGSFAKAVAAVRLLRRHGIPVRLHSILTKRTMAGLEGLVALATELGASFNYCEVLLSDPDGDDHVLTDEESRVFYERYVEAKRRGAPIMHSFHTLGYMQRWPKKESTLIGREEADRFPAESFVPCRSGDLQCFVDVDGRVYACNGRWEDGLDMNEVGFQKAWDYLATRPCVACRCVGMTELHLLLGLSAASIWGGFKNLLALGRR